MDLVPIDAKNLPIGRPLPCDLYNATGVLLARRGHVFYSDTERNQRCAGELKPHILRSASEAHRAAFLREVSPLLTSNAPLSRLVELADARAHDVHDHPAGLSEETRPTDIRSVDWIGIQQRLDVTLKAPSPETFARRISDLAATLVQAFSLHQDATIAALNYMAIRETRRYCSAHALQVALIAFVAARDVLRWDPNECQVLMLAALTMNISMAALQDTMAEQRSSPTDHQIAIIQQHTKASVDVLRQLGIRNELWLRTVFSHHDSVAGPLTGREAHERLARMLRRADVLCAKMSKRSSRKSMRTTDAMKAIYVDEDRKPNDDAGVALVRCLGLNPPGTLVRLENGETAIVLCRTTKSMPAPPVGVILTKDGMPKATLTLRSTEKFDTKIKISVPPDDIHMSVPLNVLVDAVLRASR